MIDDEEWMPTVEGSSSSSHKDSIIVINKPKQASAPPKGSNDKNNSPILSVEIPLFFFFLAYGIFTPAQQEFIYSRICLYKYQSEKLCSLIDSEPAYSSEEDAVQADYSTFGTITSLCIYPPALLTTIIMGTWCDRFSHRFALILPQIGSILVSACYLAYYYIPSLNQSLDPVYLGFVSLIAGMSGFVVTEIMACSSYISCITTEQNRTVRLGVVQGTITVGQAVGYLANAFLFSKGNYLIAFIIQIAINVYALSTIFAFVPDLRKLSEVAENVRKVAGGSWFRYLCSPHITIVEAFKVIIFARKENTEDAVEEEVLSDGSKKSSYRGIRLLMLGTYALLAAYIGILSLQSAIYAFLTLQPISISPFLYSIFQAVYSSTVGIALFILLRIVRMKFCCGLFPLSDAAIAVFGSLSRIVALVVLGLGDFYPQIVAWAYAVINMCSPFAFVSLRSGMSRLTDKSDQGRLFSVIGVCENVCVLVASISFTALYGALVSSDENDKNDSEVTNFWAPFVHGYTFFFVAGLTVMPLILTIYLGRQRIPDWSFY